MLKSIMECNPPQGRFSTDIVRFATSFQIPVWSVAAKIEKSFVKIEGGAKLLQTVIELVKAKGIDHLN